MSEQPLVLVTRPGGAADPLVSSLETAFVRVAAVPTVVTISSPPDGPLDHALAEEPAWDWIVATSALGAQSLAAAALRTGLALRDDDRGPRVAAVGPKTAEALRRAGIRVDLAADVPTGRGLAAALIAHGSIEGRRVLLARADAAGRDLPAALTATGADVTEVLAYRTVEAPIESLEPLAAALGCPDLAAGVVASPSAVRGLLTLAGTLGLAAFARALPLISIGPTTSSAVRLRRCTLLAEAAEPSVPGLVDAVTTALAGRQPRPVEIL